MAKHVPASVVALALAACAHAPLVDHRAEGQALFAHGSYEAASEALSTALAQDPHDLAALRTLIESEKKRGTLASFLIKSQVDAEADPDNAYAQEALGLTLFAIGDDLPSARAALKRAVELAPDVADFHYRFGVALYQADRFAEARVPLGRAALLAPNVVRYRIPLALCADRLGDAPTARAALAAITHLAPTPEELALAREADRHLVDPFRDFAKLAPGAEPQVQQGLAWLTRDAPTQAIDIFGAVLLKFPKLGMVHALLGLAYARLDEAGRAVSELLRAQELTPDAPQPYLYLGDLYFQKDRAEQAREQYQHVVERDPLDIPARRRLGELAAARGDWPGAIAVLEIVRTLSPEDVDARLLLAGAYDKQGNVQAVETELVSLSQRAPNNAQARLRLGTFYAKQSAKASPPAEKQRLAQAAQKALQETLQLEPENAEAAQMLAAIKN